MTDTPIACTLTSDELRIRQAHTAALARRSLRSRRPVAGGELLVFTADATTEAALRDVIAAEAHCCAFLAFDLRRAAGSLELEITGPDDARALIRDSFA